MKLISDVLVSQLLFFFFFFPYILFRLGQNCQYVFC